MPDSPTQPIRVLLVDDHPTILWGISRLLEAERPRMEVVGQATDRAAAFALARTARPDVILLDLDLDGDCSLDFLPDLRRESDARVLILTGLRDTSLHDRAVLAGARGVLHKTAPVELLLKAIEKVHAGQLWLDRDATGRLFGELAGARERPAADPEALKLAALTPTERRVVVAVARGRGATNRKLAEQLNMSEHTLRNHLASIYPKLGVENRIELFIYAHKHNLDEE